MKTQYFKAFVIVVVVFSRKVPLTYNFLYKLYLHSVIYSVFAG